MFSEYASRFLAQSQSRVGLSPNDSRRTPTDRQRRPNQASSRYPQSRSYLQRAIGNPYQPIASQVSHFPFASRTSAQPAPLFFSATDEFREENDEEEHEREIADLLALQRSRRQVGGTGLDESSEIEDDGSRELDDSGDGRTDDDRGLGRGGGIRSSWRGGKVAGRGRGKATEVLQEQREPEHDDGESEGSSKGKNKMVEVGLEDTLKSGFDDVERDDPPDGLMGELDEDPPSIQQFRRQPRESKSHFQMNSSFMPQETDRQALLDHPRPPSSTESAPPTVTYPDPEPPRHDAFWGSLYLICLAALFATWFLVYLHTSSTGLKHPLGDTIYTTLHASFHLLGIYTLVAVIISMVWLALLRSYVRPLVYGILVAVPVILYSFSLYPFISSFKGTWPGSSIQDKVMRWGSIIPAILATLWIFTVVQSRHSFNKSISILEFACRILAANSALLALGFSALALIVAWTWIWLLVFTRVFLGGHFGGSKHLFIIDTSTWWLGVFFILVYLWTLQVIAGIQRAVTAATVSQWYFHRLTVPAPTNRQIVLAALNHATNTLFGTICLSTLLSLVIRLPLLILPRRLTALIGLCTYSLIPTPIVALTNPLTLTYAAIHSQPLTTSSRGLSQMAFLSPTTATNVLYPRTFSRSQATTTTLLPYRLAKLLLLALRLIMSFALSFGGFVTTARTLQFAASDGDAGHRGSLYAYIVGMIAGAIGWGVLGSMEGVIANVVDSVVVCWGSEVGGSGGREARYCREAGWLFGGSGEVAGWGDV